MTVVVTGASGQLGQFAAERLLERLGGPNVILASTRPGELERFARQGADVRYASFDEPESLPNALAGAERMLMISTTAIGRRREQHGAAIAAARSAGVRQIVYTSATAPSPESPVAPIREHAATEAMLRESGLAWTVLRNGLYAELLVLSGAPAVESGRYVHNAGDGRTSYVSRADCAAAAAAVLADGGHENTVYDVTGPELHTQAEIAALLSEVSGRPVEAVEVSDEERIAALEASGMPPEAAARAASWGTAIRLGQLEVLSTAVSDLTGSPPRSVREVLEAHREELLGGG